MIQDLDKELTRLLNYLWQASPHNKERIMGEVQTRIKEIFGITTWTAYCSTSEDIKMPEFNWFQRVIRFIFRVK